MQSVLSYRHPRKVASEKPPRGTVVLGAAHVGARFAWGAIMEAPVWMRRTLYGCLLALLVTTGLAGYQSQTGTGEDESDRLLKVN